MCRKCTLFVVLAIYLAVPCFADMPHVDSDKEFDSLIGIDSKPLTLKTLWK
ncbi:MAG: hypothetical protein JEZ07_19385 [Phycisphaerae bacterium]|nr:hypothetical protein [Phycisphaerae bacterium]